MTGMGIVSALGVGTEATLQALLRCETCIGPVEYLNTEHKEFPLGEVRLSNSAMSQMLGVSYPYNELRTVLLGLLAAREAVKSASLTDSDIRKTAFINGTTVGGMDKTERCFSAVVESEANADGLKEFRYNDCGSSTELIADGVGHFRMLSTTSTACSSAANSIILGANLIKAGIVDKAIVGGSEALTRFHLNGFNTLMILDNDICRPFDKDRKGINLGEGAAYLVLESRESIERRGVKPLARLSGYANACDAFHQTASSENGEGAWLAMTAAMKMAGLAPESIDYINAHGTGTPNNDISELTAMKRIWGDNLPPFSSTKPFTGHATSASGSIESVICILAMQNGLIPANLGFRNPIELNAAPVTKNMIGIRLRNIINNSFGFGGNDSSLVFTAMDE